MYVCMYFILSLDLNAQMHRKSIRKGNKRG